MMIVKAFLLGKDDRHEEIRRFDLNFPFFKWLKKKVFNLFARLGTAPFQMYYKDEDGNMIAFSSDDELMMGLALVKDDTFHLFIKRADHDREWNPAKEDY
ncbi:sequestosome-1-like [Pseudorasbora parva]|uniref:sequestosome-1-like n=1 Tax=Pseudorasbora parva TaxID=51549 RepID=UPI00351EEC27